MKTSGREEQPNRQDAKAAKKNRRMTLVERRGIDAPGPQDRRQAKPGERTEHERSSRAGEPLTLVERRGIEPLTSWLQTTRSPN